MKPCTLNEIIEELNKIDDVGEYKPYGLGGLMSEKCNIQVIYPYYNPVFSDSTSDKMYIYIFTKKDCLFFAKHITKGKQLPHRYKNYNNITKLAHALMRRVRKKFGIKGMF